jgi:hypothetical protein
VSLRSIRKSYGVPAWRNARVLVEGRPGVVTGSDGTYLLRVRFDGEKKPDLVHPRWGVWYLSQGEPPAPGPHLPAFEPELLIPLLQQELDPRDIPRIVYEAGGTVHKLVMRHELTAATCGTTNSKIRLHIDWRFVNCPDCRAKGDA